MYSGCSVVKHGSYQVSLSKGLTESHSSAMHQYTTLLAHLTVTALRPVRTGEKSELEHGQKVSREEHRRCSDRTLRLQEESQPFHLPDARVQLSLEVGVKVIAQHGVFTMELHYTSTYTICSQLDTICTTPCLFML